MWASVAGFMRNYPILREQGTGGPGPTPRWGRRWLTPGSTSWPPHPGRGGDGRGAAAEAFDPDQATPRGMAFERLDQLALDHLYGVRG